LAAELRAIEDLWPLDRAAALARLAPLTERVEAAWSDEALLWSFAASSEETLIELSLPSPPRLKHELSHEELLELVRAWWSVSREEFDLRAEAWFRRVLEANLVEPSRVIGAESPEDFLARALALPPPAPMPGPRMTSSLRGALGSWLAGGLPPETLFDHVERHGGSLPELLDVLTSLDDDSDVAEDDEVWAVVDRALASDVDPLGFFARHLGVDRTQAIANASQAWRGHDVRAHLVGLERRAEAWASIQSAPVADAYDKAKTCDPVTRHTLVEHLAAARPIAELVTLTARLDDQDVPAVRTSLERRAGREQGAGMHALVVEAIEASWSTLTAEAVVAACARLFDVAPSADEPALALLQLWVDAADHSLASATAFAARSLSFAEWVPLLRPRGLRASTAALCLLEAGETPLAAAHGLRDAGYGDDDVFAALRSNGVASLETLTVLRECGWQPARMVDVLAKRDELPTEVRDRLRSLGLGAEVIRSLLADHWDLDLDARAVRGDQLTPHHMPQDGLGFLPRSDGGAIVMPRAEHVRTRTYGARGRATKAAGGSFRENLAADIRDIRSQFGTAYDDGIRQLIDYYKKNYPDIYWEGRR
jgi:hypothetical protein